MNVAYFCQNHTAKVGKMKYGLALCFSMVFLLAGCGNADENKTVEKTVEQEPAAVEAKPYYSMEEDGSYGYEVALSDEEKKNGAMAKPLTMLSYAGEKDGKHQVFLNTDGVIIAFECSKACDFIKLMYFTDRGEYVKKEQIRAEPGMIAVLALSDASNGYLKRAGLGTSKKDAKWVWFTEKGIVFSKIDKSPA